MRSSIKPLKKWKDAFSRCIANETEYETYAPEIIKYFVNEESEKILSFLQLIEQSLTDKKSSPSMVFLSLKLLKEATEKRPKIFAKALSNRKILYSVTYQIATMQSSKQTSSMQPKNNNPDVKAEISKAEEESIKNKCIRISIECILHWRLYFGSQVGDVGKVFRALHSRLEKIGTPLPSVVVFFSQQSHRAIGNLIKTGIKALEEADDISLDEISLVSLGSEGDEDNPPEMPVPSMKKQFSSINSRKSALAQLEADLIRLRQMKIEEGKMYVQERVTKQPEELRNHLSSFLNRVKDLLEEMKMKASIFENLNPNKDEKRVLEDIACEEEELRQLQENFDEKLAKPQRWQRERVFSYLSIKSASKELEDEFEAISPIKIHGNNNSASLESLANIITVTKLPGSNVETDALEIPASIGNSNQNLLSSGNQYTNSIKNTRTAPNSNSAKAADTQNDEVSFKNDKPNSSELKLLNQTSLERNMRGSKAPEKIEKNANIEPNVLTRALGRPNSNQVAKKKEFVASDSLSNMLRRSLPTNAFQENKLKLGKELGDIAKGIQNSLSRGRITRKSVSATLNGENSQHSMSVASSATGRTTPTYNLKLNFSQEIQNLLSASTKIRRVSFEQRNKTSIASDDGNSSYIIKNTLQNGSRDTDLSESPSRQYNTLSNGDSSKQPARKDDFQLHSYKFVSARQEYQLSSPKPLNRSHQQVMSPLSDIRSEIQKNNSNSNSIESWSIDKISVTSAASYNSAWVNIKDLAPNNLKEKLVVKEVVSDSTSAYQIPPRQTLTTENLSRKTSGRKPVVAIHAHKSLSPKLKTRAGNSSNHSTSIEASPLSSNFKPKKLSTIDSAAKVGLPLTARTTFKVTWHPIFNELNEKLRTKKAMNMFKRTGVYSKGIIFDNENLNITAKMSRFEDITSKRRLVKIFLLIGNKRGEYIRNFSLRIKKDPTIVLTQPPLQSKPYIKPGKQLRAELVVGLTENYKFSHLEIVCIGEQELGDSKENAQLEAMVYIPLTYFVFMESLIQIQDEDLTSPWILRSDLVLQSSGRFKINSDIVQTKAQLQGVFQHALMFPNSNDEVEGEQNEGRETYLSLVETERLGEFIYIKFDWFPKTHEVVIQTASASEKDKKGEFLIQTLLFLLGE